MVEIVTGDNYDNSDGTRKGNWMQTLKGNKFWPLDPRPEDFDIEEIAVPLGRACRYTGHCLRFYSVAEHSVLMSYLVPPELALTALMHDAPEAYLQDIARPVKPALSNYAEIEGGIWRAMATWLGMPEVLPDVIKHMDNAMLLAEREQNMTPTSEDWRVPGEPAKVFLQYWLPDEAGERFLARYRELTNG